jgi:hypothetical protein
MHYKSKDVSLISKRNTMANFFGVNCLEISDCG